MLRHSRDKESGLFEVETIKNQFFNWSVIESQSNDLVSTVFDKQSVVIFESTERTLYSFDLKLKNWTFKKIDI